MAKQKEGREERREGWREGESKEKGRKDKEKGRDRGAEVRRWRKERERGEGEREEKTHMPRIVRPNPMGRRPGIKSEASRKVETSYHVSWQY